MAERTRFFHLSIDDVFDGFLEASDRRSAIQTSPMMAALDALHDEFGVPVDLYLFCEREKYGIRRKLEDVSPAAASDIRARSWLRLGPHALDMETPPYAQAAADLDRTLERSFAIIEQLVGGDRTSRWVRLHHFSECYEAAPLLRAHGVDTLLTTDKPAIAYRLPPASRAVLAANGRVQHEGLGFVRSHLRVERFSERNVERQELERVVSDCVTAHGFVTIFSHEICFADPRTCETLRQIVTICNEQGLAPA